MTFFNADAFLAPGSATQCSPRRFAITIAAAVALALSTLAPALMPRTLAAQPQSQARTASPALVLIARHAEKVDNSADPVLSAEGSARATALAAALVDAGVTHVIVSARQRTRLTAEPLLKARGITPEVIDFGSSMAAHVAAVAAAAQKHAGEVVLIVGHSNTVPALVHALGGPKLPDLCETRYASLFAVVPGAPARVVVSSFGVPDPPGAEVCAGMSPL